jgi:hypothetical protein
MKTSVLHAPKKARTRCSAMVGTFAGAGFWAPSLVAAGFVTGTSLLLVGRLSLEPHISAVTWQVDRTIPEA